jgi:cytochrome c oxidase assembly protein subunit 15
MTPGLTRVALIAAIVAFVVIILGAYVRLSHAGLGCPDWPGCYGHVTWPTETHHVAAANEKFPERPVESEKAWKEMAHRYLAGSLVLLVLVINIMAWTSRPAPGKVRTLAFFLLLLILFQAALGMWTVTLNLFPIVVMGHLMGGLATFVLILWILWLTSGASGPSRNTLARFRNLITAGLAVLVLQLFLGGWTSANYSALACPDFPTCQGVMWPETNFRDGFVLWREIGVDYEGGVLDLPSRTSIHLAHRIGALVTFIVLGLLSIGLLRSRPGRKYGTLLIFVLLAQVTLGILNVILFLPLPVAVAHNATGALLLATMLRLLFLSRATER